jgi:DNA-binding CsgD family transcriptional regulator
MTPDTDRELIRHAERHHEPYVLALATVRLAIDTAGDEPPSADDALHAAETIASSYDSQYIRDYAMAARGVHARVFGDLSVALDAGQRLLDSPAPLMQAWGFWHLAVAGLLGRDEAALTTALDAAQHAAARQVPGAAERAAVASCWLGLLRGDAMDARPALTVDDPWLAPRDLVDRGDVTAARSAVGSLQAGGAASRAVAHAISGLADRSEDDWHEALRLADQHGLRLIAVDALEALAAIAAANDSFTEALRLLAAADRLRAETGYVWRYPEEQRTYEEALGAARANAGEAADTAWQEGLTLDWLEAAEYARRARGERGRPQHGWASITPTEQRVVDLVAEGLTNPEIAERLLMARGTVKSHLEHIFAKTGYRNRAELAAAASKRQSQPHE